MIITAATADILLAIGSLIGLTTRIYALLDETPYGHGEAAESTS